jgi:hypothetical protein
MRMIYVDEAGTSAREPVTVVVGLVVDPDRHWGPAMHLVRQILTRLPEKFRDGFVFHATELWNDKSYREGWDTASRHQFMFDMMSVPKRCAIPVSYGVVRRDSATMLKNPGRLSIAQMDHAIAFGLCISTADRYIRKNGHATEVAAVVAEDCTEMRINLRGMLKGIANNPFVLGAESVRSAVESGKQLPLVHEVKIQRVIDTVHFVGKRQAWFLQFADAIAFGLRRWINGLAGGEELFKAMIGAGVGPDKLEGPVSTGIWS